MLLTLGDCKRDRGIRAIINVSPSSQDFADIVNDACRKALRRGDWDGTVIPIQVCVRNGCLVWPRYVGHVRKMNFCKHHPVPVHNLWYEFLSHVDKDYCLSCVGGSWNSWSWWQNKLQAQGYAPTHTTIFGDGRYVRLNHTLSVDVGKTVRIFGVDNNNQELRTNNGDGTWSDGYVLRCKLPYDQTTVYVRRIDRVIKEETQGDVRLYAYNAADAVLEDLAVYQPSETNPEYERYHVHVPVCTSPTSSSTCGSTQSVLALIKLKFIPAKYDTDLVYLQNLDALKLMIQSVKSSEAGDREAATGYEVDAIRELNLDIWNRDGDDQASIAIEPFSGANLGGQHCF